MYSLSLTRWQKNTYLYIRRGYSTRVIQKDLLVNVLHCFQRNPLKNEHVKQLEVLPKKLPIDMNILKKELKPLILLLPTLYIRVGRSFIFLSSSPFFTKFIVIMLLWK